MSSTHIIITALCVLCIVLLIALLGKKAPDVPFPEPELSEKSASPAVTPSGEDIPPPPERRTIAESEIEKLYLGYRYEEIEDLFGIEADERESEYCRDPNGYIAPHTIVWYIWNNPDDTRVRLGFINNKLERKQFLRKDGVIISNEINLDDLK